MRFLKMRFGYADSGSFLICCSPDDMPDSKHQLHVLNGDASSRLIYSSRGQRQLLGYVVDSHGCVMLLEKHRTDAQLFVLSLGPPVKTRALQPRRTVRLFVLMFLCVCFCIQHYSHCHFYRAMHFSAKRGLAIACRPSVRLSVTLVDCDHIG